MVTHYIPTRVGSGTRVYNNTTIKVYNSGGSGCSSIWSGGFGCGCGCSGSSLGFWGGVGLGLGNFCCNLLGGVCGMLGFGGFGFGGLGMGGLFGGSWLGGGGGSVSAAGGSASSKKDSTNSNKKDIDNAKIADLTGKIKTLEAKQNPNADEIKVLNDEIKKAKADTDDMQKESDTKTYDNLLGQLKNYAKAHGFTIDDNGNVAKTNADPVSKPDEKIEEAKEPDDKGKTTDNKKIADDLNNKLKNLNVEGITIKAIDGNKFKVDGANVQFDLGKADLDDSDKTELQKVIKALNQLTDYKFSLEVQGYASTEGRNPNPTKDGEKLSKQRSVAVMLYIDNNKGNNSTIYGISAKDGGIHPDDNKDTKDNKAQYRTAAVLILTVTKEQS